jgi:hypothetical protein
MLLLRTAIAFRSPLLKRLDQVLRQVTYYQLCHGWLSFGSVSIAGVTNARATWCDGLRQQGTSV